MWYLMFWGNIFSLNIKHDSFFNQAPAAALYGDWYFPLCTQTSLIYDSCTLSVFTYSCQQGAECVYNQTLITVKAATRYLDPFYLSFIRWQVNIVKNVVYNHWKHGNNLENKGQVDIFIFDILFRKQRGQ